MLSAVSFFLNVVSGCLELLSPEEMQLLQFPPNKNTDSLLNKSLMFRSGPEESLTDANGTRLWSFSEGTRFNLFTGNQTLIERKESFNKVNVTSFTFFLPKPFVFLIFFFIASISFCMLAISFFV